MPGQISGGRPASPSVGRHSGPQDASGSPAVTGNASADAVNATPKKKRDNGRTEDHFDPANGSASHQVGISVADDSPANDGVSVVAAKRVDVAPGKSGLVSENVRALQELYGVTENLGRPRERIVHWLARIQDALISAADGAGPVKSVADTANRYLQSNLRLDVFYLEGILKLYKKSHPEISAIFDDVKAFEDALGVASGARSALSAAQKLPELPAPALAWLEVQVREADAALHAEIQKNWQVDQKGHVPVFSRLVQELTNGSWDMYGADKKNLVAELDRRLKKFQKADMDMGVLQGDTGVHELRRQLRWIPIYAVALDGLFRFDDARHPIDAYANLMDTDLVHSKYAQLPPSHREKSPIPFSRSLYLRITQLIDELGRIKDDGESIEAIAHALLASGCAADLHDATSQAEKILGVPPGSEDVVFAQAKTIYDEMQAHHFIRAVRDEVRERKRAS